jgi:hypothetical protein
METPPQASPLRPPPTLGKKLAFTAITLIPVVVAAYALGLIHRSVQLYRYALSNQRGWVGRVFVDDPRLGFRHRPGGSGFEVFPEGEPIPTRLDPHGFRIPAQPSPSPPAPGPRPIVLAIGCSFTFGAACRAEDAFPFRVAQDLHGRCLNAGVSGYGLAQMDRTFDELLEAHRPTLVLVQYSPWLVDRAISRFAPTYWGVLPTPYYVDQPDGSVSIHEPVFPSVNCAIDLGAYRGQPATFAGFASFFGRQGLPALLHDDWHLTVFRIKNLLGHFDRPTRDRLPLVRQVYGRMADACRNASARMVVVAISGPVGRSDRELDALRDLRAFPVVDADAALWSPLAERSTDAWTRAYAHWRGDPPTLVDPHPNPTAHRLIADAIMRAAREEANEGTDAPRATPARRISGPTR